MRAALVFGLAAAFLSACGYPPPPAAGQGPAASVQETTTAGADSFAEGASITPVTFPDGLKIVDLKVGDGASVPTGSAVTVQYTGWLADGKKFDSSRDRGQPICAILAASAQPQGDCFPVVPGWNEGVPGMKVGGRRKLIIPPALGYGDQGQPPVIPPGATLTFTIEVVGIRQLPSSSPTAG
jgi:FKBP-type peptidyl-prolyl cis-trans isomerase